ncbi:MAG: hypothetical protein AAF694_16530 [Bacteroidota bacterium]
MKELRNTQKDMLKHVIVRKGKVEAMRQYIYQTGSRLDIARQIVEKLASDIQPGPS